MRPRRRSCMLRRKIRPSKNDTAAVRPSSWQHMRRRLRGEDEAKTGSFLTWASSMTHFVETSPGAVGSPPPPVQGLPGISRPSKRRNQIQKANPSAFSKKCGGVCRVLFRFGGKVICVPPSNGRRCPGRRGRGNTYEREAGFSLRRAGWRRRPARRPGPASRSRPSSR